MSASLLKYDAACRAIAAARTADEAKEIRDRAEAMRAYARQAQNKQLEVDAAEIRIRAERRLGEILVAQKALPRGQGGGLNRGAAGGGKKEAPRGSFVEPRDTTPTLADLGIGKKLSSRAQALAAVPTEAFEEQLGE